MNTSTLPETTPHPGAPGPGIVESCRSLINHLYYYDTPEGWEAVRNIEPSDWPLPVHAEIAEALVRAHDAGIKPEAYREVPSFEAVQEINRCIDTRPCICAELIAQDIREDAQRRKWELRKHELALSLPLYESPQEAAQLLAELTAESTAPVTAFTDLTTWRELAATPVPWTFTGTIPDKNVTVIASPGGYGKSLFALGLTLSAITGKTIFPSFIPCEAMRVIHLSGEDSAEIDCRRISDFERLHLLTGLDSAIREHLHLRAQKPEPFLRLIGPGMIEETEAFRELLATVRKIHPGLVVVDTLRKHLGLPNENDNVFVGAFLECCAKLARHGECAVIVLAHSNKLGGQDDKARQTEVRGGSASVDESRAAWILKRTDSGLTLSNVKQSYAAPHAPVCLEFLDGALRETQPQVLDPASLIEPVMQWFSENPEAEVSRGGVLKGPGDGKSLFLAVCDKHQWATREHVSQAVEMALGSGYLKLEIRTGRDRHAKQVLTIGNWPNDCPF